MNSYISKLNFVFETMLKLNAIMPLKRIPSSRVALAHDVKHPLHLTFTPQLFLKTIKNPIINPIRNPFMITLSNYTRHDRGQQIVDAIAFDHGSFLHSVQIIVY